MKVNKEYIENIFKDSIEKNIFIKAIASSPVDKKSEYTKVNLKPVRIKEEIFIQFEEFKDKKAYHENICFASAMIKISDILEKFKQLLISVNGADYQILKGKQDFNLKKSENTKVLKDLDHNKKKNYLIEDGTPVPFLIKLGVMGEDGKVFKNSYDKFRQINKYLEFIDDTIRELQNKKLIGDHIKFVDFGCGKSYLTFALHYYLKDIKNFTFEIIGLELNAKAILAVPCCQHEFNEKMSNTKNSKFFDKEMPIGKHGILFEKYTSLATDAFRAQALELCGYKTQVMEFIDMEHTPKNILIRGIKDKVNTESLKRRFNEYEKFKSFLGIEPLLDSLLSPYYLIKL